MGKTALVTNIAFNIAGIYERGERHDGSIGAINGGVGNGYRRACVPSVYAARRRIRCAWASIESAISRIDRWGYEYCTRTVTTMGYRN